MESYGYWIIIAAILVFFCVFPIIILAVLFFFGAKWVNRFVTPDPIALNEKLNKLRRRNPELSDDQLVRKIINSESFKAGLIGGLTGLGGLPTVLVAVPFDFALSAKIQAELVHFIAHVYAPDESESELKMKTMAIMAGSRGMVAANEAVQKLVANLIVRIVGKSLMEVMPVIGAIVGFAFNWFTTRSMGHLATKWYKNELQLPGMQQVAGIASGIERQATPGISSGDELQEGVDKTGSNLAKPVDISGNTDNAETTPTPDV